jgi:hypothetical protein
LRVVGEITVEIEITISRKQFNELIDQFVESQQNPLETEKLIRKLLRYHREWVVDDDMERLLLPFLKTVGGVRIR